MDFNSWLINIRELIQENNGPLKLKNGHWELNNRVNLWTQLSSRIFDNHLDLIKECAITVLSELDPQFELSAEERFTARINGKVLKYSADIRKGIAETLALLGNKGDELKNCSQHKPEKIVVLTICKIFENSNWKLWASLNNILPILAEASPNEFLKAVENALNQTPCPFDELFAQEGVGITGENYMTGLLWALETLAWSEEYLARVVLILSELATHDPGGNWANRPINSSMNILLPWSPQTVASIEKRVNTIKAIRKEYPDIAWKLLLNILPNQNQVSHGTSKPTWRKFIPDDWKAVVTKKEYWEQVKAYAELTVNMAQENNDRLIQLVSNLDNLPIPSFDVFLEYLSSDEITNLPEQIKCTIWESLKDLISKHRKFADAKWAFKDETVNRIETIALKLTPANLQNLYHRLFSNNDFNLYEENRDIGEQQKKLEEKRQKAIQTILDSERIHAVIQFAETLENPSMVGWSLGQIANEKIDIYLLPQFFDKQEERYSQFISNYISGRFYKAGIEWVNTIKHEKWTLDQICQFLIYLPFDEDTWSRVTIWLNGSELIYWKKIVANPYLTKGNLLIAIDKLLDVGRPLFALGCLYVRFTRIKDLDQKRSIKALLAGVSSDEPINAMTSYNITEIIKILQEDPTIDPDDLCKIEWIYLSLLNRPNSTEPKFLEKKLSSQPEFFCEIIQILYLSKKENKKEIKPDENEKASMHNAWELLHKWKRPPGIQDDGNYNANDFLNWLNKVKEICTESGHLEVAMIHVGSVLFYAPADPSGLWIHKIVAEVLNNIDSKNIRQGFLTEVYNSRGVFRVDPTGEPEHELTIQWQHKAEDIEKEGYIAFATTLREIAKSYSREEERIIADYKSRKTDKSEDGMLTNDKNN